MGIGRSATFAVLERWPIGYRGHPPPSRRVERVHSRLPQWLRSLARGAPSRPARALLVGLAVVVLAAAWLTDLDRFVTGPDHTGTNGLFLVSGAVMALAAGWSLRSHSSARTTALAACAALLAAQSTTIAYWSMPPHDYPIGIAEIVAVIVLLPVVAYRCRAAVVVAVGALAFLVALTAAVRGDRPWDPDTGLLVVLLLFPGLYARWRSEQHAQRVERVRHEERAALARDLHDVVAHQITGIVVQAQALRHLPSTDPDLVRTAFIDIESAGSDALSAMRRLVGALRDGDPALAEPNPDLALTALRRPRTDHHPAVTVDIDTDLTTLPVDITAAIVRIAQESVTNADRHARTATTVTVAVTTDDDALLLTVHDDGASGTSGFTDGGYGLIGMTERTHLLGGTFTAGPTPTGWQVIARLPLPTGTHPR